MRSATVDRTNVLPLYVQIRQVLTDELVAGRWRPGDALPGELELAARFGVSRMTVRQALADLAAQGLISRRRGRATRVASPPVELALGRGRFYAFASEMARRGLPHRSVVLAVGLVQPVAAARAALRLDPSSAVARVTLLRLVGDEPLMLETASCAADLLPVLRDPAIVERPLYDLLADRAGIVVTRATEVIRAITLPPTGARHLAVRVGTPAFAVERTSYAGKGGAERPVEWRESVVRGDRYRFVADLRRAQLVEPFP